MASDCSSFIRGEPERWRRQEPEPFAGEMDTPITRDGNRWIDWRNESTASTVFNPDRDRMFVEEVAREFAGIEFKMQSLCGADCQLACLKAFLLPPSPPTIPSGGRHSSWNDSSQDRLLVNAEVSKYWIRRAKTREGNKKHGMANKERCKWQHGGGQELQIPWLFLFKIFYLSDSH